MNSIPYVGLALLLVGCGWTPESDRIGNTETTQAAFESTESHRSDVAPELEPQVAALRHLPPIPGSAFPPQLPPNVPRSTEEKLASPSWPQQRAAKEAAKADELARNEGDPEPVPTAAPGIVAKQEKFLQIVRERQAEFDAYDTAERDRVYDELKRKEIGE